VTEVALERVRKTYDGAGDAVSDLDLVCRDGEMLALLGPSGCGKSSTLKMIAGIERISGGAIRFDGVDVSRQSSAERNVAMVFEDYALYPHLTVFENIAFPLRLRAQAPRDIERRVSRMLDLLDLQSVRGASVRRLSGGAQQRVSIGRALVREPALMLFDEPLSHLDVDQKVQLRSEIKRLQRLSGLTSVLVTHDQTEAIAMADRIAVLDKGRLQQLDEPAAIYARPANLFVAGFIGEPPMNALPAAVRRDAAGLRLEFDAGYGIALDAAQQHLFEAAQQPAALVVGVRPEHLKIGAETPSALPARVRDCEPCGDHDVLTLDTPLGPLAAEVMGPSALRPGTQVWVTMDTDRLHFFAADTGCNLRRRAE